LKYLKDRYQWVSEEIVNERLNSHLIPVTELANGGYENGISEIERKKKIKTDFDEFLNKRASFFAYAAEQLTEGKNISSSVIINAINGKTNGT